MIEGFRRFGISATLKSRNIRTCVLPYLLLAALCAVLFFWRLGAIPLIGFDEGCYAECSREMLASGNWIVPTCNGEPFYDKPPLAYWLQAASMWALGVNSFAARLPSALESLALVAWTVFLGTRLFSRRIGLMAGFVLATCTLTVGLARLAIIDALFALAITTSLGAFLLGYLRMRTEAIATREPLASFWLFWAAMGLSVMIKGPAGAVLILGTVLVFLLVRRELRAIWHTRPVAGVLVAAAIALPWYVAVNERTGGAFLREFIVHQNVQRALGKDFSHNAPIYYYVPVLLAGFFPWSVFLPGALSLRKRNENVHTQNPEATGAEQVASLFLWVWAATVFVIFSVVRSKLPGYVFPIYPACALIVARFWSNAMDEKDARLRWSALASVAAACAAGGVMLIVPPYLKEPIPGVMTALIPMSAALVLGCAAAYLLTRSGRLAAAFVTLCCSTTVFLLVTVGIGLPIAARTNAIPAMKIGREIARRVGPAFALRLSPPQPQLGFYAGRPVRAVKSGSQMRFQKHAFVVLQDNCSASLPGAFRVEARVEPYVLIRYRH